MWSNTVKIRRQKTDQPHSSDCPHEPKSVYQAIIKHRTCLRLSALACKPRVTIIMSALPDSQVKNPLLRVLKIKRDTFCEWTMQSTIQIVLLSLLLLLLPSLIHSNQLRHEKQVRTDWSHVRYKLLYNLRWMNKLNHISHTHTYTNSHNTCQRILNMII